MIDPEIIAQYITENTNVFNNKNQLFLEVFDIAHSADAMSGVERYYDINHSTVHYGYYFTDTSLPNNPTYNVKILKYPLPRSLAQAPDISNLNIPGVLTNDICSIELSIENSNLSSYQLTSLNNSMFVYGKMLACLYEFASTVGLPCIIHFTSYDKRTKPVYQRLINLVARKKNYKYVPFSPNHYILDIVAKEIDLNDDLFTNKSVSEPLRTSERAYLAGANLQTKGII